MTATASYLSAAYLRRLHTPPCPSPTQQVHTHTHTKHTHTHTHTHTHEYHIHAYINMSLPDTRTAAPNTLTLTATHTHTHSARTRASAARTESLQLMTRATDKLSKSLDQYLHSIESTHGHVTPCARTCTQTDTGRSEGAQGCSLVFKISHANFLQVSLCELHGLF